MKIGLIMEGGAMRGMFTAGVIDVLMEAGVSFDGAIGVSAGAVFGCNYKSRQIGRVIRYNKAYCQDPRYATHTKSPLQLLYNCLVKSISISNCQGSKSKIMVITLLFKILIYRFLFTY